MNQTGSLTVRCENTGNNTVLAQIAKLVNEGQRSQVPVQRLVDKISSVFVPAVLLTAAASFAFWYWHSGHISAALVASISVMVVACPCALGLATPMSILVATGRAAREGILFKEARSLESVNATNIIAFDKTGTLTEGRPTLTEVQTYGNLAEDDVLALAASLEALSEHPLGSAVVKRAREKHLKIGEAKDFQAIPGRGAKGSTGGKVVTIGNTSFLSEQGIDLGELPALTKTNMSVALDGKLAAILFFEDKERPSSRDAIKQLKEKGLRTVLITGDQKEAAQTLAKKFGIDETYAQVTPSEKAALVKRLQAGGRRVAMVGDGINDALALVQADVGIAIASGTDIAKNSADIILMNGDLSGLVKAMRLGQAMLTNIKQNLFLAFVYNALAVPLAAFGIINPMFAAAAMSFSSLAVIGNALRLKNLSFGQQRRKSYGIRSLP
jgi:Cu+-exporting ATPase